MTSPLDAAALADVAQALRRACGVVFSDTSGRPLRSGFAAAASALRLPPEALLDRLRAGDPAVMQVLVESTVVGETYFGRHPEQLEGLRQELRAIPRDRPVSVWSAGCASGEEPYTIAMLLLEEGRSAASVVATDVSEQGLGGARAARYGPWSLRGLPPLGRMRWLRQHGDGWVVCDEVRRLVRFQRHNLLHDPPPGKGFDVVLCRNVLIYFDRPTVDAAIRRLFESARHGGVVVLAPAEVPFAAPLGHARVDFRGGAFWRKGTATDTVSRAARGVSTGPRARPPPAAPRVPAPAEPLAGVAAEPSPPAAVPDPLEGARRAAAEGRWLDAEREACAVGERSLEPTPYLFAAAAAEARGDLQAAAHWLGRALFLAPDHVLARASTIPILQRLGRAADAARARREVLRALEHIPDERLLPGVEPIAAGALRSALLAKSSRERSE